MIHSTNLLKTCTSSSLSWNMVSGLCSKVSLTYLNQVPHYLGYLNTPGNSIPKVTHYLRYIKKSGTAIPQIPHYHRYLNTQYLLLCSAIMLCGSTKVHLLPMGAFCVSSRFPLRSQSLLSNLRSEI